MWRTFWVFAAATAALAASEACNDDSGGIKPAERRSALDGGSDTGTTDHDDGGLDAGADTAPPVTCPSYTGSDPTCQAVIDSCVRCPTTYRDCEKTDLASCDTIMANLSDAYRKLQVTCTTNAACTGDAGIKACVQNGAKKLQLTAMQNQIAIEFCTACMPTNAATCTADFYKLSDAGVGSQGRGYGAPLLFYNDTILGNMESCVSALGFVDSGAESCAQAFFACAKNQLAGVTTPSACETGG